MTILLVEDQPEMADLWKRLLSSIGREFREATDVPEALEQMQREPCPDLLLLDLRLKGDWTPDRTIKAIPEFKRINPNCVVLVVTGNPDESLSALAEAAGADGYEQKISVTGQDALLIAIKNAFRHGIAGPEKEKPSFMRRLDLLERVSALVTHSHASAMREG